MSSMTVRSGAIAAVFLLMLSFAVLVSPILSVSDADEREPETVVIVSESKPDITLKEMVIDYAKVYTEVKDNLSDDRKVIVDDRHLPKDEGQKDIMQKMREIIGNDHFRQPPEPVGEPPEKPSEPERKEMKVIKIDETDTKPSEEFLNKVVDYIDEMGTPESREASEFIRQYLSWIIVQNLNDALSGTAVSLNDRKNEDLAVEETDSGGPVLAEVEEDDTPEPLPEIIIPTSLSDVPDVDLRPYYTGVTTCGLSFL